METQKSLAFFAVFAFAVLFTISLASANSVGTALFFQSTDATSYTIELGQTETIAVWAQASVDANARVFVEIFDSKGNFVKALVNNAPMTQQNQFFSSYSAEIPVDQPVYKETGTYTIRSTVQGSNGDTAIYELTLAVIAPEPTPAQTPTPTPTPAPTPSANNAPVLKSIGNKVVDENANLQFTISATDADKDALTYSAADLPSGATFNAGTRQFSWTPSFAQEGSYDVTFKASDGKGGTDLEKITITVNNVNRNPTINAISNQQVNENTVFSLQVSASDADNDALTYSLSGNVPGGFTINSAGLITGITPPVSNDEDFTITIQVSDGTGTAQASFVLSVLNLGSTSSGSSKKKSTEKFVYVDRDASAYQAQTEFTPVPINLRETTISAKEKSFFANLWEWIVNFFKTILGLN